MKPGPIVPPPLVPTQQSIAENEIGAIQRMRADRHAMGTAAFARRRFLAIRHDAIGVGAVFAVDPRDDGSLVAVEPLTSTWRYAAWLLDELRERAEFDVEGDRRAVRAGARFAMTGTPLLAAHVDARVERAVAHGLAPRRHAFAGLVTNGLGCLIDPANAGRTYFGKPHRGPFRVANLPSAGVLIVAELTAEQAGRGEVPSDFWERAHDPSIALRAAGAP